MEQIRTVVIGFGGMGSQYAGMLHDKAVEGMCLQGICCRNAAGQQEIRARFPEAAIYKNVEDTFAHAADFDAVVIVTPHTSHVEIGKQAFACGKHVLCDKPAGISTKEAREFLAAKREHTAFAMMFNTRMEPAFLKAKELLEQEALGKVTRVLWVCNNWFRSPAYHHSSPWRSSWNGERGGLLINQCQHYLDIWQWLFGMPDEIDADIDFGKYNDFAVDDSVDLRFLYDKDSAACRYPGLRGSFQSASGENPGVNRLEIWGSGGMLTVTDEKVLTLDKNLTDTRIFNLENTEIYGQPAHEKQVLVQAPEGKQYLKIFQKFSDHIRKGTPLAASGEDGLNSLILANGAYLSAWTGQKIRLPMDDELYVRLLGEKMKHEGGNH